jgi:hypothetical protein
MVIDKLRKYADMMPVELRMLVDDAPKDDLDWGLIMYLFENKKSGNVITLGKMSSFFDIDSGVLFEILNKMSVLWVIQYLNGGWYGRTYYTYEITDIAADFMIKLVELLEIRLK